MKISTGSRIPRTLITALAAFAVIGLPALVACGGSDNGPSSSPGADAAATGQPAEGASPLPAPTVPGTIAFTAAVIPGKNYDVCVVNSDGTGLETLAGGERCQMFPRWSPDGEKILYFESQYGDQNPQEIWVMNADGSGKVQLTKRTGRSILPDWSPDGTRIVFSRQVSNDPERTGIFAMNADGSGVRQLTGERGATDDYWPVWGKDGRIYFYRFSTAENSPAHEFSIKPDGSGLTQLMALGSAYGYVKYGLSPDCTTVAYHDKDRGRVVIVPAHGSGSRATLMDPVADYTQDPTVDVAWSRDGKALAMAGLFDSRDWHTRLFVVNADGSGLSVVPGIEAARDPSWRPE